MKTQIKLDTIKNAWVGLVGEENFDKLRLNEDGYSDWRCRGLMPSEYWSSLSDKLKSGRSEMSNGADLLYRPKVLKGLENNNGWNRIYSVSDLPKIGKVYIFLVDGRLITQWCESGMSFPKSHTHWRETIEYQHPLY